MSNAMFFDMTRGREAHDAAVSAMEEQIGGDHYKRMAIQPFEFIQKNNLSFAVGNIVKYVCRYKDKNGVEDLKKARHYIDMLIEMESDGTQE